MMDDATSGPADTSASPSVESTPQTVDSVFDGVAAELSAAESTTPVDQAGTDPTTAPAIEAPVTTPETPEAQGAQGPIPFDRHKAALENARAKATEEVEQRFTQQYGGALDVVKQLQADPVGTVTQLLTELQDNPQYSQQLKSHVGRMLQAQRQRQPQAPQVEAEPEPDLQTADGELVYSARQQAKREAWLANRLKQEIGAEFAPLKQMHQRFQKADEIRQMSAKAQETARTAFEQISDQPYFKEHLPAIAKEQQALFAQGITDPNVSIHRAYLNVLHRDVLPKQQQQQQQTLVQQAAAKVRASTDNPAASAPAQPRRPKSLDDAFDMAIAEVGGR